MMRYWINIGLIVLYSNFTYASELKNTPPLTLHDITVKILENNPALKANDFEAQAAAARIRQATQEKPFRIKMEMENFAGSGRFKGLDSVETTLSLARILETGNKPVIRGQVAQHEASLLKNKQDVRRLDILSEAAQRFIHLAVDQERLQIAKSKLALVQRTAKIVTKRVNAGRSPIAEKRRVAIARSRANIELEHAEHELLTSQLKLKTMWGETNTTDLSVQAPLFNLTKTDSFAQLANLLQRNPDLLQYATRERLADSRRRLSTTRSRPDIELSGGIRHFSGSDDGAFVLSASIPLGSRARALANIQESESMALTEPLLLEQRRLALYASLFEIYQEMLHAQTAFEALQEEIIPVAKQVLRDYEKGYQAGRYSLLELTEAQKTLLNAQLEMVVTAEKHHKNRIEIERLTGAELNTGVKQ